MGIPAGAAMSARQLCHCKVTETKNRNLALPGGELYGLYLWEREKKRSFDLLWKKFPSERGGKTKIITKQVHSPTQRLEHKTKIVGKKKLYSCEIFSEDKMFKISPLFPFFQACQKLTVK